MDHILTGIIVIPGIATALLLLVISYLQHQLREPAYRVWELAWGSYLIYLFLLGFEVTVLPSAVLLYVARVFLIGMVIGLLASSKPVQQLQEDSILSPGEMTCAGILILWAGIFVQRRAGAQPVVVPFDYEIGLGAVLAFTAWRFYREGHRRDSIGYRLLAISAAAWSLLAFIRPFHETLVEYFSSLGHFLGPVPHLLLGISMLVVMFEFDRRQVQENSLALSTLEIEPDKIYTTQELEPAIGKLLERVMRIARTKRAFICIRSQYRHILPSVQRGFSPELLAHLENEGITEPICKAAYRRGGLAIVRDVAAEAPEWPDIVRGLLLKDGIQALTAVSLQARNHHLGALLLPHDPKRAFSPSQLRTLLALNMQIGLTLDNYILMWESRRRTEEYELLTHIGQAISSRLDPDEVLRAIHKELGRLFDTSNFFVAFEEGDVLRIDFETVKGIIQPKHKRKFGEGLVDHVIRTGESLLIQSGTDKKAHELGVGKLRRGQRCFLCVPLRRGGGTAGAIGVSSEKEFAFDERDLVVLQTAAGQVAVALENALLFAEAQLRAQHLAVLNHISTRAISSQNAEEMLPEIVSEIQRNFQFDYIGIGILDYTTKDLEIKAEAGANAHMLGKRVPLGEELMGRVARSSEFTLAQGDHFEHGLLQESRSVLCIPLVYGETLLGVVDIESTRENAFSMQDVLLLRTLGDLLSTALHNAFIFQKMQHQSITDALTGLKTRRYFLEALSQEWKRAARSGRPFSVVLIDLDKFKEVNDTEGHLEGDLVLARVGRLLEQKCRQSNVVARYGGDEFVILMPETGVEQAMTLSERLRLWMATDPMLSERHVTGSFGIASFPLHGSSTEDIVRVADAGMYVSKHAGGNRVSTAEAVSENESSTLQRQQIHAYLEGFLQREETNSESLSELMANLKRMCSGMDEQSITDAMNESIRALAHAVETREMSSSSHSSRVGFYTRVIGQELRLDNEELETVVFAATVHDVGKVVLPAKLLNKTAHLGEHEVHLLKVHPIVGAQIIESLSGSERVRQYIKHHHERFDGTGYPESLKGEHIPLGARIIAVADAYVNMITDRPYSPAMQPMEAVRELEMQSGTQFDGMIVRILTAHLKGERSTAERKR
ncbi:MAG: diguanylate cyclase [Terriglobia bacterium]|nr:diguanylate cyclase [Terriglobia bacterium]